MGSIKKDVWYERVFSDSSHYWGLIERLENIAIKDHEHAGQHSYLFIERKMLTKLEIRYQRIDENTPYISDVKITKQGENANKISHMERFLREEGFKEIDEPNKSLVH